MIDNLKAIGGILAAAALAAGVVVWVFYFNSPEPTTTNTPSSSFGVSDSRTVVNPNQETESGEIPGVVETSSTQKIFKISEGPVASATLIETTRPTSTIARFVMQTNGHAFDLLLDSPGTVAKPLSKTTIPGVAKAVWATGGRGTIFQYIDGDTTKTGYLGLPAANATTSTTARLQFLPSGILSFAISPDGTSVVYLLKTSAGADGYVARVDGASPAKLFSLPFAQVQLSWPSANVILAYTAPAASIPGVVLAIDSRNGGVNPLLHAPGITATADRSFSRVLYQTYGTERSSYVQNVQTGVSYALSFNPLPELCVWGAATSSVAYCAVPLLGAAANFLDLLHLGLTNAPMSIVRYDLTSSARSQIIASPGSAEGGTPSEIVDFAIAPSGTYLVFIKKEDRSLWGVRLEN